MSSLGEEYPKQQARVRELFKMYTEIGSAGQFAVIMMEDCLKRADKAVIENDLPEMIKIFEEMKGFKE